MWEDCHDAIILAWVVLYGDILHSNRCLNNVAQLHAPTVHIWPLQQTCYRHGCRRHPEKRVRATYISWSKPKLVHVLVCSWCNLILTGKSVEPPPPFSGAVARAIADVLLAAIKGGHAPIDPRGVLECAVFLDHGRLLALPCSEHASYGVDQLRCFMASHRAELDAAHVHCDHALAEWAHLKEHMVSALPISRCPRRASPWPLTGRMHNGLTCGVSLGHCEHIVP